MTPNDIRLIIKEVLAEQKARSNGDIDAVALRTFATVLTSFGLSETDRDEFKTDLVHLRRWRKSVEQAQSYTFKTIITIIVGGMLGALWLGIKVFIGK